MYVKELIDSGLFQCVNLGENIDIEISKPFCCDLLSIAMSKAPEAGAWITVMGNMNTLAVASLTETACIILAEGAGLDEMAYKKAKEQGITVFASDLPIFEAALLIYQKINA